MLGQPVARMRDFSLWIEQWWSRECGTGMTVSLSIFWSRLWTPTSQPSKKHTSKGGQAVHERIPICQEENAPSPYSNHWINVVFEVWKTAVSINNWWLRLVIYSFTVSKWDSVLGGSADGLNHQPANHQALAPQLPHPREHFDAGRVEQNKHKLVPKAITSCLCEVYKWF